MRIEIAVDAIRPAPQNAGLLLPLAARISASRAFAPAVEKHFVFDTDPFFQVEATLGVALVCLAAPSQVVSDADPLYCSRCR
jgi:hypothetical protein